jgi:TPR repeat protein
VRPGQRVRSALEYKDLPHMTSFSHDNLPYRLPLISFGAHREQLLVSVRYSPREELRARLYTAKDWKAGMLLGHLLRTGVDGPRDPAMAQKIYREAMRHLRWETYHSDVGAALMKGLVYLNGWGRDKDIDRAMQCFQAARSLLLRDAQSGDARAAHDVAALFLHGLGGQKDPYQAQAYFRLAADAGYVPAQMELAGLLLASPEPVRDPPGAAHYYDRAAHAQESDFRHMVRAAQYHLGGLYYAGVGRVVDYETAYVWFAIAAAAGHEDADRRRRALESFLTTAQVLNAQKRAREWPLSAGPGGPLPNLPANSNIPGGGLPSGPRL